MDEPFLAPRVVVAFGHRDPLVRLRATLASHWVALRLGRLSFEERWLRGLGVTHLGGTRPGAWHLPDTGSRAWSRECEGNPVHTTFPSHSRRLFKPFMAETPKPGSGPGLTPVFGLDGRTRL